MVCKSRISSQQLIKLHNNYKYIFLSKKTKILKSEIIVHITTISQIRSVYFVIEPLKLFPILYKVLHFGCYEFIILAIRC